MKKQNQTNKQLISKNSTFTYNFTKQMETINNANYFNYNCKVFGLDKKTINTFKKECHNESFENCLKIVFNKCQAYTELYNLDSFSLDNMTSDAYRLYLTVNKVFKDCHFNQLSQVQFTIMYLRFYARTEDDKTTKDKAFIKSFVKSAYKHLKQHVNTTNLMDSERIKFNQLCMKAWSEKLEENEEE